MSALVYDEATPEQLRRIDALAQVTIDILHRRAVPAGMPLDEVINALEHALAVMIAESEHRAFYAEHIAAHLGRLVEDYRRQHAERAGGAA